VTGLTPVTIRHRNIPADIALPSSLPLTEILPDVAARLGALDEDAAVYGLMLVTEDGRELDDARPIVEQGVRAGALLTLEVRSTEAEARYDDLVEAVATEVEARQAAWSQQDSVSMSVASTCLLFLVVGLLLLRQGPGGLVTPLCALACSCLLVLAAFALWRLRGAGTWPLVMTAGALGAVAAHTAFIGPPTGLRMMAAGGALAAIVLVCLPFLEEDRWLISGPLLVASCLGLTGMGVDLLNRPLASVLAVIAAVVAIISLLAPWLALASVPIDISLPDRTDRPVLEPGTEVTPTLTARVLNAHGLVLSARIACAMIVLASVPTLTSAGYAGAGLVTAIAAAQEYLGVPYVWAGESFDGVDCSGLTMLAYQSAGVDLTHSSRVQYGEGEQVDLADAQPGDLVFWSSDGSQEGIYHVAIYLGDDQMIEAPTFGIPVRITEMRYADIMPYAVRP